MDFIKVLYEISLQIEVWVRFPTLFDLIKKYYVVDEKFQKKDSSEKKQDHSRI
jgi:hypothetical protein